MAEKHEATGRSTSEDLPVTGQESGRQVSSRTALEAEIAQLQRTLWRLQIEQRTERRAADEKNTPVPLEGLPHDDLVGLLVQRTLADNRYKTLYRLAEQRNRILESSPYWRLTAPLRRIGAFLNRMRRQKRTSRDYSSERELIANSGLYDEDFYTGENPQVRKSGTDPLLHFIERGGRAGLSPSELFDSQGYLLAYPDVASEGCNPLLHYIQYGEKEKRIPRPLDREQRYRSLGEIAAKEPEELTSLEYGVAKKLTSNADPRVSVIIPTWNRESVIGAAVASALAQTLPPFEVIVADDGSQDHTVLTLENKYRSEIDRGRLKLLRCPHRGVAAARNAALDSASGEYVSFLDSDNIWHKDHLLLAISTLLSFPETKMVYSGIRVHDEEKPRNEIVCRPYSRVELLNCNFIDLNSVVHHRSLLSDTVDFDENLTRLVDWDYIIQITRDSDPLVVPFVTVEYHLDRSGLRNITFTERLDENLQRIRMKHDVEMRAVGIV